MTRRKKVLKMIRQRLELMVGAISETLFNDVMQVTKADIVFNKIYFRQRTTFDTMIDIAVIAFNIFARYETKDNHAMGNDCSHLGVKLRR